MQQFHESISKSPKPTAATVSLKLVKLRRYCPDVHMNVMCENVVSFGNYKVATELHIHVQPQARLYLEEELHMIL